MVVPSQSEQAPRLAAFLTEVDSNFIFDRPYISLVSPLNPRGLRGDSNISNLMINPEYTSNQAYYRVNPFNEQEVAHNEFIQRIASPVPDFAEVLRS